MHNYTSAHGYHWPTDLNRLQPTLVMKIGGKHNDYFIFPIEGIASIQGELKAGPDRNVVSVLTRSQAPFPRVAAFLWPHYRDADRQLV